MCTTYPRYGSELGKAGDEKGYLVEMSQCFRKGDPSSPVSSLPVARGDTVEVEGLYWVGSSDPRIAPFQGGTHLNVMSYMYIAYALDDPPAPGPPPVPAACASKLIDLCDTTIGFTGQCDDCASSHWDALAAADCDPTGVEKACARKWYRD